jgi:AraC-like DNA-binding protein
MPGASFPVYRFSTGAYPERRRADALRDMYTQRSMRFDFEPLPERPLDVQFAARAIGDVAITFGVVSGLAVHHERAFPGKPDRLFLGTTLRGRMEPHQRGRSATVDCGDAILLTSGDQLDVNTTGDVQYLGLQLPYATLAPLVTRIDDAVARRIPNDLAALRLFTSYARTVLSDRAALTPELAHTAVTQLCDLAAVAIGATRDAAEIANGRGMRTARLKAVQRDIAAHLGSAELSLDRVAARQGISPSYVRKLFEGEETSFSDYVLSCRLLRARRMLSDPRLSSRPISTIAFDIGFGDLSYFNRAFRRCYGATPSEVRAAARPK